MRLHVIAGVASLAGLIAAFMSCSQPAETLPELVSRGDVGAVRRALERGSDVNAPVDGGIAPLMLGAANGNAEMVKLLIERGARVDLRDSRGETALYKAAGPCGRAAVVALLLSRGAHVDAQTKYGRTPLMEAASWASIETVEILLRAGANPNATDREGRTPLMCVGDGGPARSAEVFRLLVAAGGNVHARAPNGMTALTHAQSLRCPPCVDVLLARGARL